MSFWAGGGEGSGRGRGEGAGGAGRLAPRLWPRRPPGHHRGLRGAGGPGAGGRPPRPHESAPPSPPEPRRRQGPDGGPQIAQRPGRWPPVASRRCPASPSSPKPPPPPRSLRPGAQGAAPPPRKTGRGARAARRARGRRTIAAAGARAAGPSPQGENLRGPVALGRCRPPRSGSPRLRLGGRLRPGRRSRGPPARLALPGAGAEAGAGGARADRWGRRECAPRPRDAAAPALGACPLPAQLGPSGKAAGGAARRSDSGPRPPPSALRPARRAADAYWAAEGTRGTPAALQRPRLARRRVRRGRSGRKPRVGLHLGAQGPHCRGGRGGGWSGYRAASGAPSPPRPTAPGGRGTRPRRRHCPGLPCEGF